MPNRSRTLIIGWVLALLAVALFARLGAWQLQRAEQKQAMLANADRVLGQRQPLPLAAAADPLRSDSYDWSAGSGRFEQRAPLLLDNQQRGGRSGVRAYRVFVPEQGALLLVDLGWLPLDGERVLPAIELPSGSLQIQGLLAPPPAVGIALGEGLVREGDAWLLTRLEPAVISRAIDLPGELAPRVLRLDPALPIGYDRDLELLANTLPPEKHQGYAVQWFGLALTVLATALILTLRKPRRTSR